MAKAIVMAAPLHAHHLPTPSSNSPSPPHSTPQPAANPAPASALTKRKQSKSRPGCITCKAKRLKCDETKPTCQQCARRAVACGGYKKDFKWRPFEEPYVPGKPPAKSKKDSGPPTPAPSTLHQPSGIQQEPPPQPQYAFPASPAPLDFYPPSASFPTTNVLPVQTSFPPTSFPADPIYPIQQPTPFMGTPQSFSPVDSFASTSVERMQGVYEAESLHPHHVRPTTPTSTASAGQSPRLLDLLLPGTDLNVPPAEYSTFRTQHEAFYQPAGRHPLQAPVNDDVEEVARSSNADSQAWRTRLPSPTGSYSSHSSSDSPEHQLIFQPRFALGSPESLTRRFDRDTCGVLSVVDGPTENPWRTLIWPLARDCPALYHAVASMTSFHQSTDMPVMRIHGIDHMRSAVHALAAGLQNMRFDAAISTTLVLAFSESWDQHISTGINHIKGAKILINQALLQHAHTPKTGDDWTRLKFLCNTWIYMDVIARLTAADDDETSEVDAVRDSIYATGEQDTTLDPLMGCAQTLFPIIGHVANLVRKVRRTESNGPSTISQAVHLKSQLEEWMPPSFIEDPEDESTSPTDSIKTATAYQYATLLYLHQAVPEVPSQTSGALAKKVLCELATVEPRSRSIIVQIYPLMAAGCEATDQEDRDWVVARWASMITRMKLGILERCLEVTKEVWARRDAHAAERCLTDCAHNDVRNDSFCPSPHQKRDFESYFEDLNAVGDFCWLDAGGKRRVVDGGAARPVPLSSPSGESIRRSPGSSVTTELLERDFTVKGRAHWLGVMKEWNWEVLLG